MRSLVALIITSVPIPFRSQDLSQLFLLIRGQTLRELDVVLDDEVSSFSWLLAEWHTETWIGVLGIWLSWTCFFKLYVFTVDGCDCALPASESFFQIELNCLDYVVTVASEYGVLFLVRMLVLLVQRKSMDDDNDLPLQR